MWARAPRRRLPKRRRGRAYRPPTDLCSALDFGPLADAIAPNDGPPKGKRTGADPATGSGAACLQPFGKTLLTDQQVIAAWPSMGEIVQALLPELRS